MRIVYVEDNPDDANLVHRYVRTTSHEIVIVDTIEAAFAVLEQPADLILIDVLLQKRRIGLDMARTLRESEIDIPLVAVTALSTPGDIDAAHRAGFDEVLPKPFRITELASVIERYGG